MKKYQNLRDSKRGFTLIELLVVISIIGILSSVVLASLNTAKYRANDAKRRIDLRSMQTALELYYNAHGAYPSTAGAAYGASPPATVMTAWIPGIVAEGYISRLPQDPAYPQALAGGPCNFTWPSMYTYKSTDGTSYMVLAHCPANSSVVNTPSSDGLYDPVRPTWAWKVCSGIECSL